jgi:hypothetical protein
MQVKTEERTMYQLASGIFGGTVALFAMGLFVPEIGGDSLAALRSPGDVASATQTTYESVNRGLKGDRLTVCTPSEISGNMPTSDCRARVGQVFGSGPANVTVMGKSTGPGNVSRDAAGTTVTPGKLRGPSPKLELPVGCESAVSIAADPDLARTPSRCVS